MPVQDDITVLPADDPNRPRLGFIVKEYMGSEVYKRRPDGSVDTEITLKNLDDLKVGDELAIPWLTGGYALMEVHRGEDGKLFAQGQPHIAVLEFDVDDRHCWTCGGIVNTRGLEKLSISTREG